MNTEGGPLQRKPEWLRKRISTGGAYFDVVETLSRNHLHTVCQEARCPNLGECFSQGTATFLIMGNRCTRNCTFCAVNHAPPSPLDPLEPQRVARAAQRLGLHFVVITSVTRDDLPDGGASHYAETIKAVRRLCPEAKIEVLIPDFMGSKEALETVLKAGPDVLNHNIETVPRLYPRVRPLASYSRSVEIFRTVKEVSPGLPLKSGLMLGLGEGPEEVRGVLLDLLDAGCELLTLGQYLQPTSDHLPVARFIPPEEFEQWRVWALKAGFKGVASGPFVRSSYHAHQLWSRASNLQA